MRTWAKSSRVGACSTARPAYITTTSSAKLAARPRSWLIITSAMPSWRWRSRNSSMICACVVTSSAVVASSAISSFGLEASAMAMITRWRIPPESWCAYSCRRCSGEGRRTSLSSSSARSRAAPRSTRAWARTASAICAPIRIVGFSDRDGSWKTIAMSAPRWRRIALSDSPISSWPSKRTEPETVAVAGSRPMIARELTVLPEPDSPMSARVRPTGSA